MCMHVGSVCLVTVDPESPSTFLQQSSDSSSCHVGPGNRAWVFCRSSTCAILPAWFLRLLCSDVRTWQTAWHTLSISALTTQIYQFLYQFSATKCSHFLLVLQFFILSLALLPERRFETNLKFLQNLLWFMLKFSRKSCF